MENARRIFCYYYAPKIRFFSLFGIIPWFYKGFKVFNAYEAQMLGLR